MKLTDFDVYKDLLKEKSGLVLSSDKAYLLESRLGPVAKKWNFESLENMTLALQGIADPKLVDEIVEAMTTNETSFFRDTKPFDVFKQVAVPYFLESHAHTRSLKIWCAAASSGQEPYSIAMILKMLQESEMAGWKTSILGTDISQAVLEQAGAGLYSQFEVQRGLPIQMLMKYFTQQDTSWQISDEIKEMVEYKAFNLLDDMLGLGSFDVVFCRNVLIYFDDEDKSDILCRIAERMTPDGFLFLGGAETVLGLGTPFAPVPGQRGLYAIEGSAHVSADAAQSSVQALA